MTPTTSKQPGVRAWFLSPVAVTLIVGAAAIIPTALIDDREFRDQWSTPKSITTETLTIFGCGVLALAFGALVSSAMVPWRSSSGRWPNLSPSSVKVLRRSATVLTALTVAAYAGFTVLIARSGFSLSDLFSNESYTAGPSLRDRVGTIPGLTTVTQCGIAAAVVSALVLAQRFRRREMWYLVVVLVLATARAYLFSERLAILEVVVPVVAVFCARLIAHGGARGAMTQLAPVVALPSVIVLFGFFEYFRSWTFYRTRTGGSFGEFVVSRFAGYYTTALNNGQLVLSHSPRTGRWPFETLDGFWIAPGISDIHLYEALSGYPPPLSKASGNEWSSVLTQFANPEFNNPSGYVGPFADYGTFGGLVYFFAIGLVSGLLFAWFCQGRPFGLLLYPVLFTGLLELPRELYWPAGRTVPAWISLIIVAAILAAKIRNAPPQGSEDSVALTRVGMT